MKSAWRAVRIPIIAMTFPVAGPATRGCVHKGRPLTGTGTHFHCGPETAEAAPRTSGSANRQAVPPIFRQRIVRFSASNRRRAVADRVQQRKGPADSDHSLGQYAGSESAAGNNVVWRGVRDLGRQRVCASLLRHNRSQFFRSIESLVRKSALPSNYFCLGDCKHRRMLNGIVVPVANHGVAYPHALRCLVKAVDCDLR